MGASALGTPFQRAQLWSFSSCTPPHRQRICRAKWMYPPGTHIPPSRPYLRHHGTWGFPDQTDLSMNSGPAGVSSLVLSLSGVKGMHRYRPKGLFWVAEREEWDGREGPHICPCVRTKPVSRKTRGQATGWGLHFTLVGDPKVWGADLAGTHYWWEVISGCCRMATVKGCCRKKNLILGCLLGAALPLRGISEAAFQVQ